VTVSA